MHKYKAMGPEPLLPGIPSAPTGKRFITAAEIDYQRRKRALAHRLPVLKPEDLLGRIDAPFYQQLLRELMSSGHSVVADEMNNLLRKEERDRKSGKLNSRMSPARLVDQHDLLQRIAETLKLEQALLQEGKKESAMLICKMLADQLLLQDKDIWLARHFYLAVLHRSRKLCPKTSDRLQAEIHCLLAYMAREHNESLESALAVAIDHLAVCRTLSRDQNWQFKPNTILIRLKKPIAFYGIVSDDAYAVVDACTMPIYMISSLLEHELLISLANQIMHSTHHKAPTDEDLNNAHEFADLALQLALEVRQPVALSSALTRFGMVLRHVGAYEDAMKYFQQLQLHATLIQDLATEAIAYHNIGLCYIGMMKSVDALEAFARQKELSSNLLTKELEGTSMHEMGHLLLQEGHLWEAEECYRLAFEDFYEAYIQATRKEEALHKSIGGQSHATQHQINRKSYSVLPEDSVNRTDISWGMAGVAAGQKLYARMAGLCKGERQKDIRSVLKFKCCRKPLHPVGRPEYSTIPIAQVGRPWSDLNKMEGEQDQTDQDFEWQSGFMFSVVNDNTPKRKKVAWGSLALESIALAEDIFGGGTGGRIHPVDQDMVREIETLRSEIDAPARSAMSLSNARKSVMLERDMSMRRSMVKAMRSRSSVSVSMLDRRPTIDAGSEPNQESTPAGPETEENAAAPSPSKPAEVNATSSKPAEVNATPSKPAEVKAASRKQSEAKPTSRKQSEAKALSRKQSEAKPTSRKQSEVKGTSRKQSEAKPTSRKQSEVKPTSRKHSEVKATPSKPAEVKADPDPSKPSEVEASPNKPSEDAQANP